MNTQSQKLTCTSRTRRNQGGVENKEKDIVTLEQIEKKYPLCIPVYVAATFMGVSPIFLRAALLQGKLPFGIGVEMGQNEFYINTTRFLKYMKAEDMHYK